MYRCHFGVCHFTVRWQRAPPHYRLAVRRVRPFIHTVGHTPAVLAPMRAFFEAAVHRRSGGKVVSRVELQRYPHACACSVSGPLANYSQLCIIKGNRQRY